MMNRANINDRRLSLPIDNSQFTIHHSQVVSLLMTIEKASKELTESIATIYEKGETDSITEIVMEHITRWSRRERILHKDVPLSFTQKRLLTQITQRLLLHEPVQYIINEAWFAGMIFYVDRNVLIPRPETEELVDWIIKEFTPPEAGGDKEKKKMDVGKGRGCIKIALKNKIPDIYVLAWGVKDEGLNVFR